VVAVAAGITGYVIYNKGSQVTLPNLINDTVSVADATLRADGLVPIPKLVTSTQPTGTVVGMSPAVGTKVAANSTVTLDISLGAGSTVIVPNVIGDSVAVAESQLYSSGLGYTINWISTAKTGATGATGATGTTTTTVLNQTPTSSTTPAQPNTVLNQSPVAGATVTKGAAPP